MSKILLFIISFLLFTTIVKADNPHDTLHVVTWNLKDFGNHTNARNQAGNIRTVMNLLNADIFACVEVVNVDSFNWLGNSMGANYGYTISDYGGSAASPGAANYPTALKFGFIYRKDVVRNVSTRALLKGSPTAYSNTVYGRYPYLLYCELKGADAEWHPAYFILIHAKSGADDYSCNLRQSFCRELKDTLDVRFATDNIFLLGDFNDEIDATICSNTNISNYTVLLNDSVRYKAVTMDEARRNIGSMISYTTMIDHIFISNELYHAYVPNSARIFKNYTWANTSDHHPVQAKFVLKDLSTSVVAVSKLNVQTYPNPAADQVFIKFDKAERGACMITDMFGRVVLEQYFNATYHLSFNTAALSNGVYHLFIRTADNSYWNTKLVIMR